MLDFTFSEEQNMLRAMIKDFGTKELADSYKDRVKAERIPPELIRKVADLGLMALNIPEEYAIPCYLALGYPDENCSKPIPQHIIRAEDRMHFNKWGNKPDSER